MAATELHYVENDTLPEIRCVYKDTDGNPIDITDYTFELHVAYDPPKIITGTIVDPEEGIFKFGPFQVGDFVTGKWNIEIQITDAAGTGILTYQNLKLNVVPEIA
jgi:hypothetical protein